MDWMELALLALIGFLGITAFWIAPKNDEYKAIGEEVEWWEREKRKRARYLK